MPASLITPEIYDEILRRISDGELVTDVVKDYSVSRADVWWYAEVHDKQTSLDSPSAYTRARISQAHSMAEDTILIADGLDDSGRARMVAMVQSVKDLDDDKKQMLLDSLAATAVQRDRLRVDTRKFLLAKIAPRIYGEVTRHVELTGKDGAPIQVEDVGQLKDSLTARLAGIASRRKLLTASARIVAEDATDVEPEPDVSAE